MLTIGDLSARSGVAPSALRYYESIGLIESVRTTGNQRRYAQPTLRRVAFVRAAQQVGLSLDEIADALATLPAGPDPDQGRLGPAQRQLAAAARRPDRADRAAARPARQLHRLRLPEPAHLRAQQPRGYGGGPGAGRGLPRAHRPPPYVYAVSRSLIVRADPSVNRSVSAWQEPAIAVGVAQS